MGVVFSEADYDPIWNRICIDLLDLVMVSAISLLLWLFLVNDPEDFRKCKFGYMPPLLFFLGIFGPLKSTPIRILGMRIFLCEALSLTGERM